jgi:hypothetical protein
MATAMATARRAAAGRVLAPMPMAVAATTVRASPALGRLDRDRSIVVPARRRRSDADDHSPIEIVRQVDGGSGRVEVMGAATERGTGGTSSIRAL